MYNGYKNYATWSILDYIVNNETAYNQYKALLLEKNNDIDALAAALSEDFKAEAVIDKNAGTANALYSDILENAISEVDFAEVAQALAE